MNYSNCSNSQVSAYTQSTRVLDMLIISQLSKTDTKLVLQSKRGHEFSELLAWKPSHSNPSHSSEETEAQR